ncbi:MAG: serine/threonine protein kinase [Deltaproteobacteria bacterium]|nr:serine/threonine protein kinase [Deltaproteobacteria bacterium]
MTDDPTGEQSRALLQNRIALVGKVGFFLSGGFLLASAILPIIFMGPNAGAIAITKLSYLFHVVATAVLGLCWLVSVRVQLSPKGLAILDASMAVCVSGLLALMGAFIHSPGAVGTFQATLAIACILALRAIAIPSSGNRTLGVCAAAGAVAIVSTWLALRHTGVPALGADTSLVAQLINQGMWLSAISAVATLASRVIYGLRREVSQARRLGQYVLHEKLGEGGMGIVFRATHAMLRRETAIKLLPSSRVGSDAIARFEREVRQTARLASPNTVAVYDYGRTPDGVFYYAMEYLDGLDLHDLIDATGPLPAGRVVHILQQICGSLAEAHSIGLVHRDVKPGNAMITQRGGTPDVVKVLDFGLVKDLERGEDVGLTATGALTGTPLYMAPEAIRDTAAFVPASDLYAVAAVGYFLLTGTHVFNGNTVLEVCAAHLHAKPESPSARIGIPVPAELERLILQGLAKDPAERPSGAIAMREALLACPVEPWTEKSAEQWWSATGHKLVAERNGQRVRVAGELASTIAIDLAQRS